MTTKYEKGEKITDPFEVIRTIWLGQPVYWAHKVQTPGWMNNQQLNTIRSATGRGLFYRAIRKDTK